MTYTYQRVPCGVTPQVTDLQASEEGYHFNGLAQSQEDLYDKIFMTS